MHLEKGVVELLEKAREQEDAYNWKKASKFYEQALKLCISKKKLEKVKEIYNDLIPKFFFYGPIVNTAEEYLEIVKLAIKLFKEGESFFKLNGEELFGMELEAFMISWSIALSESVEEAKDTADKALEINSKLFEIHSNSSDQQIPARVIYGYSSALSMYILFSEDPIKVKDSMLKIIKLAKQTWEISMENKNVLYSVLSLFAECGYIEMLTTGGDKLWKKQSKEICRNIVDRCEESFKLFDSNNNHLYLSLLYYTSGCMNCLYAYQHTDDDVEQRQYFDKGLRHLEKSLELGRETKNKYITIMGLYFLDQYAFLSGNFMVLQKRIMNDIKEIAEAGEIFESAFAGILETAEFYVKHLPSFYYSNIAQLSFFTPNQRYSYARRGIDYALETLTINTFEMTKSLSFLSLTFCYAVIVQFAETEEEREISIKQMMKYANEAKKIGDKYGGGQVQAFAYNSLYTAYKTLANITETKEERVKLLSSAAEASKNYLKYASESRTGIIAAQMRLGLLYEEIGISTKNEDTLMEAKDLFNQGIKGSLERGYYSYAGTTYEYIARIEDRLGNHIVSAEYYKKAQENHTESLNSIEYKLLKDRVEQKALYAKAWNLIERAKAYHKNENHLKAIECYEKASNILKNLPKYVYEGYYNAAWALLEKAESYSKQEKQEEAINQYKISSSAFERAIEFLKQSLLESKDQPDRERIKKLEQVAHIRINYCIARINLEEAIISGKKGEHSTSAEKFAIAASVFRNVCTQYKLDRERKELEAIYYLCRAWESMELAEKFGEPERFEYSANLFTKASKLFIDTKLKLLSLGNSAFCQALELGCKFDESIEFEMKKDLYPQIKLMLSKAASSYGKGGFENVANWALATSIYFDAAWYLIQADKELNINDKGRLLNIGSNYLRSALDLFYQAGYKNKANEVQDRLNRVEKEESILLSALNTIKEPTISRSTKGIIAPSCAIESSQSPRLGETLQLAEEERRIAIERLGRKKYELVYRDLLETVPKVQKRECRVGIAQIGLSPTGNFMIEYYKMDSSGLLTIKENKVEELRTKVRHMIDKAHNEGINLLLFPELTIDLNHAGFLELISELSKLYEMYLIPGSFHDLETRRNISIVFGPEGILWEQEKHIPAVINLGAGKFFKEGIKVSSLPQKTIICNTEYGRIVISTCRDFLDMDLRVELKNFEPPIDIILNPALTPVTADFKAAHFDARRSIYAYCFFANVAEFGDSLIYTPEKDRTERIIPKKEEGLIYKDIDLFKLRSERKKWEREQNKERQFIQSTKYPIPSPRIGEIRQFSQKESTIEPTQLAIEEPILLLLITKGGVLLFSYPFTEELKFDDEIISGFLTAFNSFSDELFSIGLDRAKFGDYSVVMDTIADYSLCYVFKGQIIPAKQKLIRLKVFIQNSHNIWQQLENYSKTSRVLEIREVPSLLDVITEIFIK